MAVHSSACPLDCPDACSLSVTVEGDRVTHVAGTHANPATQGYICAKVASFADHMACPERLLFPAVRTGRKGQAQFRRVSWDKALQLVAQRLSETRQRHGGQAILPFHYGGSNGFLTNEAVDQRLFRRLEASRLARTVCAAATGRATAGLYGRMPGVGYADYVHAALIVMWGSNPTASGIHLLPYIQQAQRRGARLVVIDPRRIQLARRADLHLSLRPGTDLPLALALIRWLFQHGRADLAFLQAHASGVDQLRARADAWTLEQAADVTGVDAAQIEQLAEWYAEANPALVRCGWGLERNRNGGSAVAAVLALPAVAGKFGVRGGGYTLSNSAAVSFNYEAAIAAPVPDTRIVNMNLLGETLAGRNGPPVHALFVYNCNPLATMPAQEKVRAGLAREDLFTVVFDQVMTDTARYADVVLPATTFLEHEEFSRGYGAYAVQRSRAAAPRVGEARPNYEVFAELCHRTGLSQPDDPVTPAELTAALLRDRDPQGRFAHAFAAGRAVPPDCGDTPVQFVDVFPRTPDRKVCLFSEELDRETPAGLYRWQPDPATKDTPLALISPAVAKWISSTFGQLDRRPAVLAIHPIDAAARAVRHAAPVRVWNALGEVHCLAHVTDEVRPGVVSLPKGLWSHHTANGATANALVPDTLSDLGQNACFNDARVQVAPA